MAILCFSVLSACKFLGLMIYVLLALNTFLLSLLESCKANNELHSYSSVVKQLPAFIADCCYQDHEPGLRSCGQP